MRLSLKLIEQAKAISKRLDYPLKAGKIIEMAAWEAINAGMEKRLTGATKSSQS